MTLGVLRDLEQPVLDAECRVFQTEVEGCALLWGFLAEKQKKQNIRSQAAVQAQKREAVFQPENLIITPQSLIKRAF